MLPERHSVVGRLSARWWPSWWATVALCTLAVAAAHGQQESEAPETAPSTTGDRISSAAAKVLQGKAALGTVDVAPDQTGGGDVDSAASEASDGKKRRKGTFVALPYPISNPTFGSGIQLISVYIRPLRPKDEVSPPSVFALGGFYTDSKSWLAGAGAKLYLFEDRLRFDLGLAPFDLRYDFYGTGNDAGDDGLSVPIRQDGLGYLFDALVRVGGRYYAGVGFGSSTIDTRLDRDSLSSDPPVPPGDLDLPEIPPGVARVDLAALSLLLKRDSRDNQFFPLQGSLLDLEGKIDAEWLGSDFEFQTYTLAYNRYFGLRQHEDVLAVRGSLCDVEGDAPFFALCMFGKNNDLRGYVAGRYRDHSMFAFQGEYRRRIRGRWRAVLFAGVGEVAPDFGGFDFDHLLPSAGLGARFAPSKRQPLNIRLDVAWGKEGAELYFGLGEAF